MDRHHPRRRVLADRRALQPRAIRRAIGTTYPGIVISDRWNGYSHLDPTQRQACWRICSVTSAATQTDLPNRRPSGNTASSSPAGCSLPGAPTSTSTTTATGFRPRSRRSNRATTALEAASPKPAHPLALAVREQPAQDLASAVDLHHHRRGPADQQPRRTRAPRARHPPQTLPRHPLRPRRTPRRTRPLCRRHLRGGPDDLVRAVARGGARRGVRLVADAPADAPCSAARQSRRGRGWGRRDRAAERRSPAAARARRRVRRARAGRPAARGVAGAPGGPRDPRGGARRRGGRRVVSAPAGRSLAARGRRARAGRRRLRLAAGRVAAAAPAVLHRRRRRDRGTWRCRRDMAIDAAARGVGGAARGRRAVPAAAAARAGVERCSPGRDRCGRDRGRDLQPAARAAGPPATGCACTGPRAAARSAPPRSSTLAAA